MSSWVIVPPRWAELTVGWDFCTFQNAPRFALLVVLLTALIFASQTLVRFLLTLACTDSNLLAEHWNFPARTKLCVHAELPFWCRHQERSRH